ncbi:hypothetical protein [Streptomyces sp. MBT61]|uniref:hypothetical protein n=1 Tax=Streptomyces sp. MBT61 TaxID=1488392 RepID=UPI001909B605|nr:hypothetical protein [Streptomyces sp. MBT61]MBK3549076.1 hypothetical protein [Streptomyces sp. MBT61]
MLRSLHRRRLRPQGRRRRPGPAGAVVFARRAADAAPALRACARCPVRRQCEETVAPGESWFDGVSAGRLWRNGRPVALDGAHQ